MKTVLLQIPGSDQQYRELQLAPGTKVHDVLNAHADLKSMIISRPEGGTFKVTDNIYDAVKDGQKLAATPANVSAGVI